MLHPSDINRDDVEVINKYASNRFVFIPAMTVHANLERKLIDAYATTKNAIRKAQQHGTR